MVNEVISAVEVHNHGTSIHSFKRFHILSAVLGSKNIPSFQCATGRSGTPENYRYGFLYSGKLHPLIGFQFQSVAYCRDEVIQERASRSVSPLNGNPRILTIDIEKYEIANTTIAYARNQLEKLIVGCATVVYEDHIVLIINRDHPQRSS